MKNYIAPACEIVNLAPEHSMLLEASFKVDPNIEVTDQLSNRAEEFDGDWDD